MNLMRVASSVGMSAVLMAGLLSGVPTANAQSAAERAVEAAKQYAGTEISIVWEAGLQSLDPLNFSGPKWEELTGIKVKVIEVPTAEMFTKILQEHRAGTGAYDALNVIPSWMPDLVNAGALEVLDPYVDKYGFRDELQKIAPTYRDNQMTVDGKIYGFPDDGDLFVLYYRKDLFEDPENQAAFKAKYGYDLGPPETWQAYADIGTFFTDKYAPDLYGAGQFRGPAYGIWLFEERFRVEGGRFFDPETMKARINDEIGVKVYEGMRNDNSFMPPGVETWGFVEALSSFLSGDIAMTISWPPFGRWAAGYGVDDEALSWVPKSTIAGKVGYALPPGGTPQLAAGFFAVRLLQQPQQGGRLPVHPMAEQRGDQPAACAIALRLARSVPGSPLHRCRVPVPVAGCTGLSGNPAQGRRYRSALDLSILQIDKYEEALRQSVTRLWAGEDAKTILDDVAAQWDALTERIGVDKQKAAYADWAGKPNAYPAQ